MKAYQLGIFSPSVYAPDDKKDKVTDMWGQLELFMVQLYCIAMQK